MPETQIATNHQSVALLSPQDLKIVMDEETARRKLIKEFIADHMVRGVDYGPIHIAKNCDNKYNCTNKYHFSKDCLFKPGAEKFSSLFKLRAAFERDKDTWEMLGSQAGTVAYTCHLLTTAEVLVGEGKGVCTVAEKSNANIAVKIAKKRAFVDATLTTGGLSDFFTQDLEDTSPEEPVDEPVEELPIIEVEEADPKTAKKVATMLVNKSCEVEFGMVPDTEENFKNAVLTLTKLEWKPENLGKIRSLLTNKLNPRGKAKNQKTK